jgi:hypothetical protein
MPAGRSVVLSQARQPQASGHVRHKRCISRAASRSIPRRSILLAARWIVGCQLRSLARDYLNQCVPFLRLRETQDQEVQQDVEPECHLNPARARCNRLRP